jgi:chorismate mutase
LLNRDPNWLHQKRWLVTALMTARSVECRGYRDAKSFETERDRKALLVDSVDPISNLRDMRDSIDNIDAAIIHMLAERFRCTRSVGKLKALHGLPPSDPRREAEQVSRLRQLAAVSKLDPDFAEKFLAFVIREVIRHHESIPRGRRDAGFHD